MENIKHNKNEYIGRALVCSHLFTVIHHIF